MELALTFLFQHIGPTWPLLPTRPPRRIENQCWKKRSYIHRLVFITGYIDYSVSCSRGSSLKVLRVRSLGSAFCCRDRNLSISCLLLNTFFAILKRREVTFEFSLREEQLIFENDTETMAIFLSTDLREFRFSFPGFRVSPDG